MDKEELVGGVIAWAYLGHSDHKMREFVIVREVRNGISRTAALDFWKADFDLLTTLLKSTLGDWTFSKKKILKMQE